MLWCAALGLQRSEILCCITDHLWAGWGLVGVVLGVYLVGKVGDQDGIKKSKVKFVFLTHIQR